MSPDKITAQRRAPFGDSPDVGPKGRQTQQRILTAALAVFDEVGYGRASVGAITEAAGCSRPSFYQYFEGKEELFRLLAGQLGRALAELSAGLGPVGADTDGRAELRRWIEGMLALHERYRSISLAFTVAVRNDETMKRGAAGLTSRYRSTLADAIVDSPDDDITIEATSGLAAIMAYGTCVYYDQVGADIDRDRFLDGLADLTHRCLFGRIDGVNLGPGRGARVPARPDLDLVGPTSRAELKAKGEQTRVRILDAARSTFVQIGYEPTRIDDIAEAAGLSHGAVYRYFPDKEAVFHEVAVAAAGDMIALLDQLPSPPQGLDGWALDYFASYQHHQGLFSMWTEAGSAGVAVSGDVIVTASAVVRRALRGRDFGDAAVDSVALFALAERAPHAAYGYQGLDSALAVRATARFLERGFLAAG